MVCFLVVWLEWTECSKPCGTGIQSITKMCGRFKCMMRQATCNNFACDGQSLDLCIFGLLELRRWGVRTGWIRPFPKNLMVLKLQYPPISLPDSPTCCDTISRSPKRGYVWPYTRPLTPSTIPWIISSAREPGLLVA